MNGRPQCTSHRAEVGTLVVARPQCTSPDNRLCAGLVAATAAFAAAAIAHGGRRRVVIEAVAGTARRGKDGEQAAHVFMAALHTDDIIGVLVADQHLKFRFTIWTIVFVQWHEQNLRPAWDTFSNHPYCIVCRQYRQVFMAGCATVYNRTETKHSMNTFYPHDIKRIV